MSDDVTPADEAPEPGDLTARLRSLEERISSEAEITPARRRRTPADPTQRFVPPPLPDDDPLSGALDQTPRDPEPEPEPVASEPVASAPEETPAAEPERTAEPEPEPEPEPVASAPEETPAAEPERTPEPPPAPAAKRAPVKKAVPRKAPAVAELGSGDVAAAAVAAASTPAVKRTRTAPAKKAATKAPAKAPAKAAKAPAKRTGAAAPTGATPWPVGDTAAAPPPVPAAARTTRRASVSKAPVATPDLSALPRPAAVPLAKPAAAVPVAESVVPARKGDVVVRVLLTLTVLLLAVAAGFAAAALVENRDATYSADVVVRIDPGNDPQGSIDAAVLAGMTRYLNQTNTHAFTLTAAQRAAVAEADLRTDVQASQVAARQIRLAVQASTSAGTQALANGAGDALVELVNLDQASNVASPGDRLSAAIERSSKEPVKTSPKDRDAYAAGGLAAGAVLLLSGVGVLLRFTRSS